jgi:membrane protein YqaA with SNARE-associated domain
MRRIYDWTIHWSRTKYAKASLFLIAFAESSFFLIPPDVLLVAMTVANRYKWWIYAGIATAGSVLGGVAGYYIGLFFFQTVGQPIVDFYHLHEAFKKVEILYEDNAFLAVFTAAFTPIPYKVFTIGGGFFQIPLEQLIIGSLFGRAARFFAVAGAIRVFGRQISNAIEKYFDIFSLIFMLLLIGGFIIIKLL